MKEEMRQKLAREPFAEKIRKVEQLIRLVKTFPRRSAKALLAAQNGLTRDEALKKGAENKSCEFTKKGSLL